MHTRARLGFSSRQPLRRLVSSNAAAYRGREVRHTCGKTAREISSENLGESVDMVCTCTSICPGTSFLLDQGGSGSGFRVPGFSGSGFPGWDRIRIPRAGFQFPAFRIPGWMKFRVPRPGSRVPGAVSGSQFGVPGPGFRFLVFPRRGRGGGRSGRLETRSYIMMCPHRRRFQFVGCCPRNPARTE